MKKIWFWVVLLLCGSTLVVSCQDEMPKFPDSDEKADGLDGDATQHYYTFEEKAHMAFMEKRLSTDKEELFFVAVAKGDVLTGEFVLDRKGELYLSMRCGEFVVLSPQNGCNVRVSVAEKPQSVPIPNEWIIKFQTDKEVIFDILQQNMRIRLVDYEPDSLAWRLE